MSINFIRWNPSSKIYELSINDGASFNQLIQSSIKFPSTQVPSSDPNTLDDYEEFTWTPIDSSGAGLTLTVTSAFGVKIGKNVYVSYDITFPSTANGNNVLIGGFPFISNSIGFSAGIVVGYQTISGGTIINWLLNANDTKINANKLSGTSYVNSEFSLGRIISGGSYKSKD